MKKVYKSSEETGAPLSGAYEANGFVFVSGQIHMDENGRLVGENTEERFEIVVSNIKKVLAEAGLTLKDVISVRLYLVDVDLLSNINEAYMKHFTHPLPARTSIGVSELPKGASIEMDVVAVRE
jgi:2-iminobutanoate/2-iminopropanoate deaminase